jgi:hypothetical protein
MTTLSIVTSALERSWTAIRTVHPDVREAAMVVYLHPRGDRRGHYWQESWTTRDNGSLDEVHVSSHILSEGSESVFRTLLHEACHSTAITRGLKDTSRQGRYHNRQFYSLAWEFGLVTLTDRTIGCVTTGMTARAQKLFANPLAELAQALDLWQDLGAYQAGRKGKAKGSRSVKLVCPECKRIVRASRACVDYGPITCGVCLCWFVEVDNVT